MEAQQRTRLRHTDSSGVVPPPANAPADFTEVSQASTELAVGELSKFLPSPEGGALAYVRGRSGVDEAQFNARKDILATQTCRWIVISNREQCILRTYSKHRATRSSPERMRP